MLEKIQNINPQEKYKNGLKVPCNLVGPSDPWELLDMFEVDVQLKDPRRGEDHKKLWFTKDVLSFSSMTTTSPCFFLCHL